MAEKNPESSPSPMFPWTGSFSLQGAEAAFQELCAGWDTKRGVERLWNRDSTLWTDRGESKWLGWLEIAQATQSEIPTLLDFAISTRDQVDSVVLLGMGGSSLAAEVWKRTFGKVPGFPELFILDSTVPAQIQTLRAKLDLSKTLFLVASKSGSTIEPNTFMDFFYTEAKKIGNAGDHFVAITDPGTAMVQTAKDLWFRGTHYGRADIGGRFSALSNFGMLPLALMGGPIEEVLARANEMTHACRLSVRENPGVRLGLALSALKARGQDKLTFITSREIASFAAWAEQLIAESTGKENQAGIRQGLVPIEGEFLGEPASLDLKTYQSDRVFIGLLLDSSDNQVETRFLDQARQAGFPTIVYRLRTKAELSGEMFRWEIATAVAGAEMHLNPFDQPDVESAKVAARELLNQFEATGSIPSRSPSGIDGSIRIEAAPALKVTAETKHTLQGWLKLLLSSIGNHDYFAINAYLEMNEENDRILQRIRQEVRKHYRCATTVGYGPRFLHSTGQLHKGGANNGVFLQIVADDAQDLEIPNRKSTFGVLKQAQADGDFQVLADRARRILKLQIGPNVQAELSKILEATRQACSG